jgi:hypothetical protein
MNTDSLEDLDKVIEILKEARKFRAFTDVSPVRPLLDVLIDVLLLIINIFEENPKSIERLNPLWSFPDAREQVIKKLDSLYGHRPSMKEFRLAQKSPAVDELNKDLIIHFPQFSSLDSPPGAIPRMRDLLGRLVEVKSGNWGPFMGLWSKDKTTIGPATYHYFRRLRSKKQRKA